ncbi:fused MFS/spermidine synthase [Candidatus Poribacteria bacterium]
MAEWKVKKSLLFALAMVGFTATAGQIIVVREFIVVFYGNELCLGLILANWLLWGAVGSWILGRLADKIKKRTGVLASCQIFLAFLLPALIFAARSARVILKAQPGELIGLVPISIFTFVVLSPLCAILGFLFSLGARMYPGAKGAKQIGHVYILEGIGASVGGLLTSLLLIRYLNAIQIAMIIGALNLASAASLRTFLGYKRAIKVLFRGAIAGLLALNIYMLWPVASEDRVDEKFGAGIASLKAENLHLRSLGIQWGMQDLRDSRNSIYGNLTVLSGRSSSSFYSNGLHMFTIPTPASAEQVAHFPMLEHPDPRRVLLIGGGVGGSLGEILKYPSVEKVDYVELDPLVIELAQKWAGDITPLDDARVEVANVDGRLFVKQADHKYDVVILDLPEPFTAQLNRFYTMEFFQEVHNILTERGVFSLGVFSSANYVSDDHQKFLNCIYRTLEGVFPEIITIPADDQAYFISCMIEDVLTYDGDILSARLDERQVESLYVSRYQMPAWLEPWRVNSFVERVREPQDVNVNRDFHPVSYYYDMILWTTQFSSGSKMESVYKDIFIFASRLNLWWFITPAILVSIALFLVGSKRQRVRREYILVAVMVTGFAEIAFEVMVSLAFQIIYGYMYYKLGLILTAFMVGLILGSVIMTRIMDKLKNDLRVFMLTQVAVCIYPLILLGAFWALRGGRAYSLGANVIFPILPVIAGFIGGFQFPLATKIYLKHKTRVGRVAGLTYGMDLIGACAGAFLVSAFLVPIIGIPNTSFAIVLMSVMALVLLAQSYFGRTQPG